MTEDDIKMMDTIIHLCTIYGISLLELNRATLGGRLDLSRELYDQNKLDIIIHAAEFLRIDGFIEIYKEHGQDMYKLTDKGLTYKRDGKYYSDYLKEQQEKEAKQTEKDERDEKTKDAQLQKLEAELAVLKDMQNEQRIFWKSGIDRDNRQRWQFWLTLFLAAGGFIMGIINFVKDIILP